MTKRYFQTLALAVTLAFIMPCTMVRAQDASKNSEAVAGKASKTLYMEEITVTATKIKTNFWDYAGSLTVMDESFLEDHGIEGVGDLTRYVPNVYFKKATSSNSIVIRGLSTIDTSLFDPAGLYVDDVAYPISYMIDQQLFDVERVEVLRGPQGTLYGRNSESGVINLVFREPDNEFRFKLYGQFGSYMTARGGFSASGPMVEDTLFYSLSFLGDRTDGYMENDFRDEKDVAGNKAISGRGKLRWTPNLEWDISLALDASSEEKGVSTLRYEDGPNATDWYKVNANEDDQAQVDQFGQVAKIKRFGLDTEFTSITSHRNYHRDFKHDSDRTSTALGYADMDLARDSWSQEFRLASSGEKRLTWLVGLFGSREDLDVDFDFNHVMPMMVKKRATESQLENAAAFGQVTYELTDRLALTGGLRVDFTRNWGKQKYTPFTGLVQYEDELEETNWLPMASLSYDLNRHLTAYATYSQGFLAPGFNYFSGTDKDNLSYDSEHTANYEIGLKTNWLENRLTANLAVFHTEITDKQVREEIPGAGVGVWKFTNAAKAHATGVELEMDFHPTKEIGIFGGFGYTSTEVDDWTTTTSGVITDYSGKQLPWSPEITYNIGASYNHQSGFFGLVDLSGGGVQYFDAANTLKDDGFNILSGRLGYRTEKIEVALWCDNIFDDRYATKKVKSSGYTLTEDGEPRTFGVTFNWRY